MAVPRCDLATVRGRLIAALNAAPAATWATTITTADDDRRNDTELNNLILAADARICKAHASRYGDGYRSLFITDSLSLTHGAIIPDHLGPIEQVRIKYSGSDSTYRAGKFDPLVTLDDIERWRANPGGICGPDHDADNSLITGFYRVHGNEIFYTGSDAKVYIAVFTRSDECQSPESDEDMLLGLSLGDAIKEGDTIGEGGLAPLIVDARNEYALLLKPLEMAA